MEAGNKVLWSQQVKMQQQAHLLILRTALYTLHHSPLVPSKHVLQVAVPDWLSASPVSLAGFSLALLQKLPPWSQELKQ